MGSEGFCPGRAGGRKAKGRRLSFGGLGLEVRREEGASVVRGHKAFILSGQQSISLHCMVSALLRLCLLLLCGRDTI